ncbi:hypothetical protein MnTg02_00714 [bacterium MnTg02]|nr:hypothetical protein MnTg02_00714 [bacterium MnTg02]
MPGRAQSFLKRADKKPANTAAITKSNFRLCRMDVDVNLAWRQRDKQGQNRRAATGQKIAISRAHRARQQLVLDRPPIDKKKLQLRIGAVQRRKPGIARKANAIALRRYRQRILGEIRPHQTPEPVETGLGIIGIGGCQSQNRPLTRRQ